MLVSKPHLLERLSRREPLTIVRGPRGYGKTSLVSSWARALPPEVDVAWVSCRIAVRESGGASLWRAVLDALAGAGVTSSGQAVDNDPRTALLGALRAVDRPLVLVLDDFHLVTEPGAETVLIDLVRKFQWLSLVVCVPDVSSMETVRAATIDSAVVRPTDLLFTVDETRSIAAELGCGLNEQEVRALQIETAGWPALVRAILTNGAAGRRDGAAIDLRAGDPFLHSVWQELRDVNLKRFILRTALLDELSASDAQWCSGLPDVEGLVKHLQGAGLLVMDQGSKPHTYHYIPAVRRACVALLRAHEPRRYKEAAARAAQVCTARGRTDVALRYLVDAELWSDVAEMIGSRWVELVAQFPEDVVDAVQQMPKELLERHARLVIALDHLLPVVRRTGEEPVNGFGRTSGHADVSPRSEPGEGEVFALPGVADAMEQSLAQIALLRMTGDYYAAKEVADRDHDAVLRSAELHEDVREELAPVLHEWAVTRLLAADLPGALSAFREAVELATAHDHPAIVREASVGAALACAMLGYLRPAEEWLAVAGPATVRPLPHDGQQADGPSDRIVEAVRGIIALERVETAGMRAARSFDVPEEVGELWALAAMIRAQVALVDGTHFQILGEIEAARAHGDESRARSLREALLVSASVDLHLALGHISRARLAIGAATQSYEVAGLARARTEYLSGEFTRAAEVAHEWLRTRIYAPRSRLDFLLIVAAAEHARGRRYEAAVALEEAVAISTATGLVRGFLKVPRKVLLDLEPEVPRVRAIMDQPDMIEVGDLFPAPTISAQLSERERQVLESLSRNSSLAGVARSLYLSSNTVKTHLRSIYRKLGTHSSVETVERAFELGIIDRPG